MYFHDLCFGLLLVFLALLSLVSAGHALVIKRDPRSAFGWIVVSMTIPLVGPFLYWSMGINRIQNRVRRWQESGRRIVVLDAFQHHRVQGREAVLPAGSEYLRELRTIADKVVSTPLTSDNQLVPLHNGEGAYPAMLEAIGTASHSVNLCTYIFDGNLAGRRFIEALKAAANRGVAVRVIIDGLGEKYSCPTARSLLKGSGVKVARFLPLRRGGYMNLRNHRKILVVDGSMAFTGGMNIGDRHLVERTGNPPPVVDMHFQVTGPVVAYLQKVFLDDWFFVTGEFLDEKGFFPTLPPAGTALARVIEDGPDKEFRKLEWIIMGVLSCARKRVQIMTPYFIPERALISALSTTAMRGVEVSLILPGLNNLPLVHWATRAYLWEILQHGIRVYYQPPPFVHSKYFLADGLWSLIGSANLDPRSLRLNFELNLEVYDRDFTGLLEQDFRGVLARSRQVTLAEMDGRPLPEKLRDGAAKLFSPYL